MADEQKASAYQGFVGALAQQNAYQKRYRDLGKETGARQELAQAALEEGDATIAEEVADPYRPIDEKFLGLYNQLKIKKPQKKLEELITNNFDKIIGSAPDGLLENLLIGIEPKKGNKDYEAFAQQHAVYQTAKRKDKTQERFDEIKKHYDKQYAVSDKDTPEKKEEKEVTKNLFLSFYTDERRGTKLAVQKYHEIHEKDIEAFESKLKDKKFVTQYLTYDLGKDPKKQAEFLQTLVALQQQLQQRDQSSDEE